MPVETTPGYEGIGPEAGTFVKKEDAFTYAIESCLHGTAEEREEFRDMVIEWYYSGNWIET